MFFFFQFSIFTANIKMRLTYLDSIENILILCYHSFYIH